MYAVGNIFMTTKLNNVHGNHKLSIQAYVSKTM